MRRIFVVALLVAKLSLADSVVHKFELWGRGSDAQKLTLYFGWTNGYVMGAGMRATEFSKCLEQMTSRQAVAMIEKYDKDHPEEWSNPLAIGFVNALTVPNSPCEGKSPLAISTK
jgi:hypothetical protein